MTTKVANTMAGQSQKWLVNKTARSQNCLILWSSVLLLCHDLTEPHNVTFPHSLIFYILAHDFGDPLHLRQIPPPLLADFPAVITHISGWSYSSLKLNHFRLSRSANSMTFGILNTIYVYNPIAALRHYCTSSWAKKCIKRLLGAEIQHLRNRVSRHIDKMHCNTEPG